MNFWKLVGAIVLGNIITGLILWLLSMLFLASIFSNFSKTPSYGPQAGIENYSDADLNAVADSAVANADEALAEANRALEQAKR